MRLLFALLLVGLLLTGCTSVITGPFTLPNPSIAKNLAISESDWKAIQDLAIEEKGWAVWGVSRLRGGAIEIRFKNPTIPTDDWPEIGSPIIHYKKVGDEWKCVYRAVDQGLCF